MKATLIISVYKNVTDLKVVLDALQYQTEKNFEIIISEDGESEIIADFVGNYSSEFKIRHLSQPDAGWLKNKALNRAVKAANTPYLIFIDADCVLHHRFIENHLYFAADRRVLAGKRVKLGPRFSDILRNKPLLQFENGFIANTFALFRDKVKFFEEGIYVSPKSLLSILVKQRKISSIKGCNFSCFKQAMFDINGFDEDYIKPAVGEDADLDWRFKGLGYEVMPVRNYAIQYHLFHKENWTTQEDNLNMMRQKQAQKTFRCENGLEK